MYSELIGNYKKRRIKSLHDNKLSWANQTRILSEQWKELLGILGNGLIQVLTPLLNILNNILSSLISVANSIASAFGGTAIEATKTSTAIEESVDNEEALGEATENASKEAKKSKANFDELNTISTGSSSGTSSTGGGASISAIETTSEIAQSSEESTNSLSIFADTLERLKNIDLQPLNNAFDNFKTALGSIGDKAGGGLKWLLDNVLTPLAEWSVEEALPSFLELLTSALGLLDSVIEVAEPAFQWLWENFLQPIANWTGDLIIDAMTTLTDIFNDLSDLISGKESFVDWIKQLDGKEITIISIATAIGLVTTAITLWNTVTKIATVVTKGFSVATTLLSSPITLIIIAIALLVAGIILLVKNWDKVKEVATKVWEKIKEVWESIGTWFDEHVKQPVKKVFTDLVDNIKKMFTKEYWTKKLDGFKEAFKTVIKNAVNSGIDLFNKFIDWINEKLDFKWDAIKIAGQTIVEAGHIQLFTIPRIPKLATGTVVPANYGEFLATLGDNKKEPEVVSPLSTIEQALTNALSKSNGGNQTIVLEIDGTQFGRMVNKYGTSESRRKGVSLRSV